MNRSEYQSMSGKTLHKNIITNGTSKLQELQPWKKHCRGMLNNAVNISSCYKTDGWLCFYKSANIYKGSERRKANLGLDSSPVYISSEVVHG